MAGPVAARDTSAESCTQLADTMRDLALAIEAAGGARGPGVESALARAAAAAAGRIETSGEPLKHAFVDLSVGLHDLQTAIGSNRGPVAATDMLLALIDELDASCHAVLAAPTSKRQGRP